MMRTYDLPLGGKDGLRDDLFPCSQLDLVVVLVSPVTDTELVHDVQVEDPVQYQRTVTVVSVILLRDAARDGFGAAEEDAPAKLRRVEVYGLNDS